MQARLDMAAGQDNSDEEHKSSQNDLAYHLMESTKSVYGDDRNWNTSWLTGDTLLAIVAGSDPTSAAFMGIFAELAKHPEHAEKIYQELANVDVGDFAAISGLPHLNAVIKEAMRLYPSLPTGGSRKTGNQEVTISGHIIPPHTTIIAPRYTISRRPDCYARPTEFIPERWSTNPELTIDSSGYMPFGFGHRSCVGRKLAEDLMRRLIAGIVKRFTFTLAPGETGSRVHDELRDEFVPRMGPLSICFEER